MTFGIIGYGRFGKLWADLIAPFGDVRVFDNGKNSVQTKDVQFVSLEEAVDVDMLFLLVPISAFRACCEEVAPLLTSHTVVVDACSVKEMPARVMQEVFVAEQPLIATHPLFGPDSVAQSGVTGKKIVVSPLRGDTHPDMFEQMLRDIGLLVLHCSPEEHDKQMARSQALVHFLGRGLAKLQLQQQEIATPDYESLLRMQTMVENDTWQLFQDMQTENRYAKEVRDAFLSSLHDVDDSLLVHLLRDDKNPEGQHSLEEERNIIDAIDKTLVTLLAKRLAAAERIGHIKKKQGIAVEDFAREAAILERKRSLAHDVGIDQLEIEEFFSVLFQLSKARQK